MKISYLFYWIWQCTFGLIQSLIGFVMFIKHKDCKHEIYHGAIVTYHNGDWGGISLGMFTFVNGRRRESWVKDARIHEYGHTIQSLFLGPLYLVIVGLPSLIWASSKKTNEKFKTGELNYFDLYCESGANTLGAWVTKEPKPLRENTTDELIRRGESLY